MLGKLTIS